MVSHDLDKEKCHELLDMMIQDPDQVEDFLTRPRGWMSSSEAPLGAACCGQHAVHCLLMWQMIEDAAS